MATTVHSICIAPERGVLKESVEKAVFVTDFGIEGDGHCGNWGRQVTCLDWDSVLAVNEKTGKGLLPGNSCENVAINHMAALDLQVGDRFRLGDEVILEVTQIGKPDHPSVVTRTFGVSLLPSEGRFCRVIQGGTVCPGDSVTRL